MQDVSKAKDAAIQKSFTSQKFDWIDAVCADPRLKPRDFQVAYCIIQTVNAETGIAILSDLTIKDKTNIPVRWISRSRASLREAGWIDWRRTRTANHYWLRADRMNAVLDLQILLREKRIERREKLKLNRQVVPPVAYLNQPRLPSRAKRD